MTMWIKIPVITLIVFVIIITLTLFIGQHRTSSELTALLEKLVKKTSTPSLHKVDYHSLNDLPEPVQKYFRYALPDGQSFINTTWLEQAGKLKVTPEAKDWSTFKADQVMSQNNVSFLWDAKINIAPLIHVRVRDSLIEGIGSGNVYLMSAVSMGSDSDKAELNSAALYRYLAEAVWHPTALLPQSGVSWEAVDEYNAIAHFSKFDMTISLQFRFNDIGEITGIYTEDRYGKFGDHYTRYPWEGRFSNYKKFDGIKIPTRGEVGWHLPGGWWLFWQGEIIDAKFEYQN